MVHAGAQPEPMTGARQTPIFQTTSYVFHDADHAASLFNLQTFGFIYSRLANPTVAVLEERIASLEGGRGATCCATGHAAQILAFFPLMRPGDSFVASNKLYGGSITQFGKTFPASSAGRSTSSTPTTSTRCAARWRRTPRASSSRASPTRAASSPTSSRWPRSRTPPAVR